MAGCLGANAWEINLRVDSQQRGDTKSTKLTKSADQPPNALFEKDGVEIHQQADPASRQTQIGQHLGFMEARKRLDRLDLDDKGFFHQKIQAVPRIEDDVSITDRQRSLTLN